MKNAVQVRVMVGADHTVRLPDEIPAGEAEIIVLFPADPDADLARRTEARKRLFGALRGRATISEDFDAPLPEDILRDFEGSGEP